MSTNRSFILVLALFLGACAAAPEANEAIRLNQIGFYVDGPKQAVVLAEDVEEFFVVSAEDADTVFAGQLGPAQEWEPSGERVRLADFTSLSDAGEFAVLVPGIGRSHSFRIEPNVMEPVARGALKAFYYQRMSMPLEEAYAGVHARPAGHPDTSVMVHASAASETRPEGTIISAPRGWYDAGDYNKYIVNSGISTSTLLSFHEHFSSYAAALDVNIPESGDAVPDVLDEALWNLRWMLDMQDPADGGVYHKLTAAEFEGVVMPHEATSQRYVVQKGTSAALNFAAVMAQGSRIFRDYESAFPGLADSMLTAALDAWNWARQNPDVLYRQNEMNEQFEPDVVTGAYGDGNVEDEFDWAAMELYVTTSADSFLTSVDALEGEFSTPSWGSVRALGYYSILSDEASRDVGSLRQDLLAFADELVAEREQSAYGIPMGGSPRQEFIWGSSAVAANQGIVLIHAYRLTDDPRYLHAAQANLDYLLGRNATTYSFVTGFGDKTPQHPHHRPSEADDVAEPVPGMLAGGPNPGQQDDCVYPSSLPARSYSETWCSYASNEIAINWNAPLVYLAGAIDAIYSNGGRPAGETVPQP